ncbi:protein UXT-like [Corticium candelabrum]|uniref:protein UXT-like n=1 Tax=Corticium candelabrum TaxID=121492 RepID=UPI002E261FA7|nr:protein UXT-like [Corticium candelabrum]
MSEGIDRKVLEYEAFVNEILKRDLKNVYDQRDAIYGEIADYYQLRTTLENIKGCSELKTQVDLGCNFYVQANIPSASHVFVAVGFGFFVEMDHNEALMFIDKKTSHLQRQSDTLTERAAEIKGRIKLVLEGLRELQSSPFPQSDERNVVF